MNKFSLRLLLTALCAGFALSAHGQGLRLPGQPAESAGAGLAAPEQPAQPLAPIAPIGPRVPTAPVAPSSDGIAAIVGNDVVTDYDLRLRMRDLAQQVEAAGRPAPSSAELRAAALNQAIDELALAQRAEQTGLAVSADTIQHAVAQVAANNKISVEELRRRVEGAGMSWTTYQTQIKHEILIGRLRERVTAQVAPVSSAEIDDFLARQDAAAGNGKQVQYDIAQIFLPLPTNASEQQVTATRQRMDAIEAQLKQGADFGKLAQQDSQGANAKKGGELGMRPANQLPNLFVETVRDMQPGQVSGVIRSPAGMHILKLVAADGTADASDAMQSNVREIVIRTDSQSARQQARKELDAVRDAVERGRVTFASKASELSQDVASAKKGGEIGWVLPGQLDQPLDAALERLNPGDVSAPIVMADKVVLLQLVDRAMRPLAQDQKRALAREMLQRQKAAQDFQDLIRNIRAETYVHIPGND